MNQEPKLQSAASRARWQRPLVYVLLALLLLRWGPCTGKMLAKGWTASCVALERQEQIHDAGRRLDALQREVAYARTSEGRDVEAKRRFGVGPGDEIWITVDAQVAAEQKQQPQSLADRTDAWLANAGSHFVDRIREVGVILSYFVGLGHVDGHVAVPVIEDLEIEAAAADAVTGDSSENAPQGDEDGASQQ